MGPSYSASTRCPSLSGGCAWHCRPQEPLSESAHSAHLISWFSCLLLSSAQSVTRPSASLEPCDLPLETFSGVGHPLWLLTSLLSEGSGTKPKLSPLCDQNISWALMCGGKGGKGANWGQMANTRQTAQGPVEPTWPWEVSESMRHSVRVTKNHSAQDWRGMEEVK